MVSRGFSLIELVIVMLIGSMLLLLVGSLSSNQVTRAERIEDEFLLNRTIQLAKREAFFSGQSYRLKLDGKQLLLASSVDDSSKQVDFNVIFFPPQELTINRNGFVSPAKILFSTPFGPKEFDLNDDEK